MQRKLKVALCEFRLYIKVALWYEHKYSYTVIVFEIEVCFWPGHSLFWITLKLTHLDVLSETRHQNPFNKYMFNW